MSDNTPPLHSSIVALVSLASGIAAKHPDMGMCQLEKLKQMDIPESQIETVIEIARHIRDEAAQKLDVAFDEKASHLKAPKISTVTKIDGACCSTTTSGQSCC